MNTDTSNIDSIKDMKLRSLENSKECNLKLGDKVFTKKLGFPTIGTVIGIVDGMSFLRIILYDQYSMMKRTVPPFDIAVLSKSDNSVLFSHWLIYLSWPLKPVIHVEFDKPQKIYTLEEILSYGWTNEEAERIFNDQPLAGSSTYPIDDIELVE